jgi:hypothetical protein
VSCTEHNLYEKNQSVIQKLSGRDKQVELSNGSRAFLNYEYSKEFGQTVITEYSVFCDLAPFTKAPRFSHVFGFFLGSLILGFASDRGGRKIIILACIWTTGVMSLFQLVGEEFISYTFFQFFIGLFIGVSLLF